jgi:protein-L-isoaspartate(D-aspartate) O-methyltransferase
MTDYAAARFHMVEGQIRTNRVTDEALVEAFMAVPREVFVPKPARGIAYVDEGIQVAPGRYLVEPMIQGWLLDAVKVARTDVALDVGCGTGYSTALLARLAATVVALESDPDLAARAVANLRELGADNAIVVEGPLPEGHPKQAPYDVIVIEGAVAEVPSALLDQLAPDGRLVAIVAPDGRMGRVRLFQKVAGTVSSRIIADGGTPMLPGFEPKPAFEF